MSAIIGSKKINFSEEQGMLLDVAREFVKDKSPGSEVRKLLESEAGFSQPVWQELVDLGWTGINLPVFGLAPSGVYHRHACCQPRGALLPHLFTLT